MRDRELGWPGTEAVTDVSFGRGKIDHDYLDYVVKVLRKIKEYGFYVGFCLTCNAATLADSTEYRCSWIRIRISYGPRVEKAMRQN